MPAYLADFPDLAVGFLYEPVSPHLFCFPYKTEGFRNNITKSIILVSLVLNTILLLSPFLNCGLDGRPQRCPSPFSALSLNIPVLLAQQYRAAGGKPEIYPLLE